MLFARTLRLSRVPFRFNAMANRNFSASRIRNNVEHVKSLEGADDLSPGNAAADAKLAVELNRLIRSELHSYVKLMFSFGVGLLILGLGGGYKLILHDGDRDDRLEARLKTKIDEIKKELMEDIAEVKKEVKEDIAEVKKEVKEDIAEVKKEVKQDITQVKKEVGVIKKGVAG